MRGRENEEERGVISSKYRWVAKMQGFATVGASGLQRSNFWAVYFFLLFIERPITDSFLIDLGRKSRNLDGPLATHQWVNNRGLKI